jgi:hypothetical protein
MRWLSRVSLSILNLLTYLDAPFSTTSIFRNIVLGNDMAHLNGPAFLGERYVLSLLVESIEVLALQPCDDGDFRVQG